MQADRYSTERAARAGVEVQTYTNGAHFTGTADALVAADLVEAEHLPAGAKRVKDWHDRDGNFLCLRKIKGGRLKLSVHFSPAYSAWREKAVLAEAWVLALPNSEEAFRRQLHEHLGSRFESFIKYWATRPLGGFQFVSGEDELRAAFQSVLDVIDTLPVRFSAQDREQQVRRYRAEAQVLEPSYRQFRNSLLTTDAGTAH